MTAETKRAGDAGFALVEALASLLIVGMISLLLMQGLDTGRRVWERIDTRSAAGEAVDGAQGALRDRIEQTFLATLYDQNPPYVDIDGQAGSLQFLAPPPQAGRPAPLRRYRLGLTTAGDLLLSSVSDVASEGSAVVTNQVLLHRVRALDIAYFGPGSDHIRRWRQSWQAQPDAPELVRVRVTFDPGDPRAWPDLIIRPRATIDAGCTLNFTNGRCKGRL